MWPPLWRLGSGTGPSRTPGQTSASTTAGASWPPGSIGREDRSHERFGNSSRCPQAWCGCHGGRVGGERNGPGSSPSRQRTGPKRGGVLRLSVPLEPVGFDPHQTIAFSTMIPLSFTQSRLVKVKAGPSVKPGTYPVEGDLAESWSQPSDTTWIFKLRKGVRWHPKPPVNGRELTAEDVKYTYDRFLALKGNGNRPILEVVDKIEAVDRYTVKFTTKS